MLHHSKSQSNSDKVKISKYLSMLLRHKPQVAGIVLDEYGYADVDALLKGVNQTHYLTRELLNEIVKTDDKQRYSFDESKTRIRANQGHSLPVNVELEEREPPEWLWHGTAEKYVDDIDRAGLIAKSRLYVHLSSSYETAVTVGRRHGTPVVYRINSKQMHADGCKFYKSANNVWLTKYVSTYYLEKDI